MAFGELFHSKESTVYQWEYGRCIPRLAKLIGISIYFNVSLDSILSGRATGNSALEERLDSVGALELPHFASDGTIGRFVAQFHLLPEARKERLIGYLDALSKNDGKD